MKKSTKNYLDKSIQILNSMGIKNNEIIVTGSVALDIYGVLPDNHNIHDFDCIINVNDDRLGIIKLVCEIFKSNEIPSYSNSTLIDIKGFKINIWFNLPNEKVALTYNGVGIKDMLSILAEKKKYNREKDIRDINQIVKKILN